MNRVCLVTAAEITVKAFLLEHLRGLMRRYDVTMVLNTEDPELLRRRGVALDITPVAIERKIRPLADLQALLTLWRLFRAKRFAAVHSVTPKAGLLTMLAGALARVPVRLHVFTGQVWATRTGFSRWVLKQADRVIALAATHVLADSWSQRDFLIAEGVVAPRKIGVLGAGSISGVDLARFHPSPEARDRVRAELRLPVDALVFLFLGRLNRDKGVPELARAFSQMAPNHRDAHLLIVGPDEEGLTQEVLRAVEPVASRVRMIGFTDRPEQVMAAADVYCLPSHREGFGTAVIEAAATGLPAIASRIYGLTDSIEDWKTGLLHTVGKEEEIAALMARLASDPALRAQMGVRARARAEREFSAERLTTELVRYYERLLAAAGT
jgi:glycosyltransferase involved in cell wall biosynthesis